MNLDEPPGAALRRFLAAVPFGEVGAVVTDLDGTVVHEVEGRAIVSASVEAGLAAVRTHGRPVIVDTMRFPLSVIRVFGHEWFRMTGTAMPLVALNGSQIGQVAPDADGRLGFSPIAAFALEPSEIDEVMAGLRGMLANGHDDLLVFFYAVDWTRGEWIWTPRAQRRERVAAKYRSASGVISGELDALAAALHAQPLCMIFLLVDAPEDRLMAYQHTRSTRFVTHVGVDKRSGAEALAQHLGVDLAASIGGGDAPADTFLDAVGFAVVVGNQDLKFRGRSDTVRVPDPAAFGALLATASFAAGSGA